MSKAELIDGFNEPKIYMSNRAAIWISKMVELHTTEVGFYGTVSEHEDNKYVIEDIFYPKHNELNGGTCEISTEGLFDIAEYLIGKGREDEIDIMRMWGHSHHTMGTSPSAQDESMGIELARDNGEYLIRLITNKKGEFNITFYDMKRMIKYTGLQIIELPNTANVDECIEDIVANINGYAESYQDKIDMVDEISNVINEWKYNYVDEKLVEDKIKKLKVLNAPIVKHRKINTFGNHLSKTYRAPVLPKDKTALTPLNSDVPDDSYGLWDDPQYGGYF